MRSHFTLIFAAEEELYGRPFTNNYGLYAQNWRGWPPSELPESSSICRAKGADVVEKVGLERGARAFRIWPIEPRPVMLA
jgi:hypothetical protein